MHVRVVTRPNYGECWSLNLSSGGMALGVARKSADGPASGLNKPFNERATDDAGRTDNESVIGHRTTQP